LRVTSRGLGDVYKRQQLKLGSSFIDEVFSILETLESNPHLFAVKFNNIREAVINKFPFVVIYEILPSNEIIILSVFHFRRNPDDKNP
jgi:hypothetical protein